MRIATLIIALVLMLGLFVQSVLVSAGGSLAEDAGTQESGSMGVLVALLWLVAAAFVLAKPRVSAVLFAVAGLLAFAGTGDFPDLWFWGGVSLVLAGFSWLGYREKRKKPSVSQQATPTVT